MTKRRITKGGRIDILADELLIMILSFLTYKEAVKTRILSRRWRYVWSSNLEFELTPTEFVDTVNQAMRLYQGSAVDKLIIRLLGTQIPVPSPIPSPLPIPTSINYNLFPDVCRRTHRASLTNVICYWISFAMEKKCRVFELASFGGDNKLLKERCFCETNKFFFHYDFPDLDMFLSIMAVEPKSSLGLVSLTSFRLLNIHIKDEMIEYLLSNCPLLEELCIKGSEYLSNLKVVSASLKSLTLCNCRKLKNLEIFAVNLVSFEYMGHPLDSWFFHFYEGELEYHVYPLLSVTMVENALLRSVRLQHINIKDEMMEHLLSNCRHLEQLYIKGSKYLINVNVVSPSLKYLSICQCRDLKNLKISATNLVSFEYEHYLTSRMEFCFEDVPLLSELIIDFYYMQSFITQKHLHGTYYNQLEKLVLNLPSLALSLLPRFPAYWDFPRLRALKQIELSIALMPSKSLRFCVFWAMACPFLSTFCIQFYEEYSKLSVSSDQRERTLKELQELNSYSHEHLKVVKLIDFTAHMCHIEFAVDLVRMTKSLEKLIIKPKNDSDRVKMIRYHAKHLQANIPTGAELVIH